MLKFFRLLRLSRIINNMNSTEDVKASMKLFKLTLFLLLYVHVTGCVFFFIADIDKAWNPA